MGRKKHACPCSACLLADGSRLFQLPLSIVLHIRKERDQIREHERISIQTKTERRKSAESTFDDVEDGDRSWSSGPEADWRIDISQADESDGLQHLASSSILDGTYALDDPPQDFDEYENYSHNDLRMKPLPDYEDPDNLEVTGARGPEEARDDDSSDLNLEDDPLFIENDDICGDDDFDILEAVQELDTIPPAFAEAPEIRNAYIRAFVMSTFDRAPDVTVHKFLVGQHALFESISAKHGVGFVGLDDMALNLPAVERRLGISTKPFIVYYLMCNVCWKRHELSFLRLSDSPACTVLSCSGILWTTKVLASGKPKRTPTKLFSYAPIIPALQRILLRPGKYDQFQQWRGEGDEPGAAAPISEEEHYMLHDIDEPLQDISDGWGWREATTGLERRRVGRFSIEDVQVHQRHQRFVSLPCGLFVIINADWYQANKWGNAHSIGAIYAIFGNLPPGIRFLREETLLLATIPGPNEPSLEQLNQIIEPFVREMLKLERGIFFKVHDFSDLQEVHAKVFVNASDLPASRKMAGAASFAHLNHFCSFCDLHLSAMSDPSGFDSNTFRCHSDVEQAQHAFFSRWASTTAGQTHLFERHGKRFSMLDGLAQWGPRNSPVDLMHAMFLTILPHIFRNILLGGGMFYRRGRRNNPLPQCEEWIQTIIWPYGIGRLPNNILSGGRIKADQWRTFALIAPLYLYVAWQHNGTIPNATADNPPSGSLVAKSLHSLETLFQTRRKTFLNRSAWATDIDILGVTSLKMNRNFARHYDQVLKTLVGLRKLNARALSRGDVIQAQSLCNQAFQEWTRMNCHLTQYFHIFLHHPAPEGILRNGPPYATWLFAFERNNKVLSRFNTNGRAGGEVEGTVLRSWVKSGLVQDLNTHLHSMEDPSADDAAIIELLDGHLKGGVDGFRKRGTLLQMIAAMSLDNDDDIVFSNTSHNLDLRFLGDEIGEPLYHVVLDVLQDLWLPKFKLISDMAQNERGVPLLSTSFRSYDYVTIQGMRHGAGSTARGASSRYAYIDGRIPIEIVYIIGLSQDCQDVGVDITADFAMVRRFLWNEDIPEFPWSWWGSELGIHTWVYEKLGELELVGLNRLSGTFVLATVPHIEDHQYWVTIAYDHKGQEPD